MEINKLINEIIEKRKSRLPLIQDKVMLLNKMKAVLQEFDDFKSEIIDENGNIIDGKYSGIAKKNPEIAMKLNALSNDSCISLIDNAVSVCSDAERRFSRESINIGVIGKNRVGKSEFLKSISNLSNYVIPAFSDSDCTGAVSIIENNPGTELEARFDFKTEREIIAVVQQYLDKLIPDENNRIVIRRLTQIRDLDLDDVRSKMVKNRADNNKLPYLESFVFNYNEWAPLINSEGLVLYDEKQIQTYVAQNNGEKGDKRVCYYKYLAVKSCHISCTFDYKDAGRITLVDTVGFEDNADGIEEQMLDVVRNKSDAVVFILFPLDKGGNGVPRKICDIYNKIQTSCSDKNLEKWLFWLVNYAPNHPATPNPYDYCEATVNTLSVNDWAGALRRIIDVNDKSQVREEFLIPLLESLTDNLDDIDKIYLDNIQHSLSALKKEYFSFCACANKVLESEIIKSIGGSSQSDRMINSLIRKMKSQLRMLSEELKGNRDIPCNTLRKEVNSIINRVHNGDDYIPSVNEILEQIKQGEYNEYYISCCNRIRCEIVNQFAATDQSLALLVEQLKNRVADILISDDGARLGKILPPDTQNSSYEWLKEFNALVLKEGAFCPSVSRAFTHLYDFDFSVRGFLTYEVRAALDAIDPDLTNIPDIIGSDDYETADNINYYLAKKLTDVADLLRKNLDELYKKPNRAFFATVKEFSDTAIHSQDVGYEWLDLYRENFATVWAEESKSMAEVKIQFAQWENILNSIMQFSENPNVFKI